MTTSKIQMLKGNTTPPVFCAKLTEMADEIEYIVCAVQYKTGEASVFSTPMPNKDVAWLRWVLSQDFRPELPEKP